LRGDGDAVGDGLSIGIGTCVGIGIGTGVPVGSGSGIGVPDGVGSGVCESVGIGTGDGDCVGFGDLVFFGDGLTVGDTVCETDKRFKSLVVACCVIAITIMPDRENNNAPNPKVILLNIKTSLVFAGYNESSKTKARGIGLTQTNYKYLNGSQSLCRWH